MISDAFARIKMNAELVNKEGNDPSPFRSSAERKALKKAKKAKLEFRKSKGYEPDTFWRKLLNLIFKNKK